jgi:hypothetical protein
MAQKSSDEISFGSSESRGSLLIIRFVKLANDGGQKPLRLLYPAIFYKDVPRTRSENLFRKDVLEGSLGLIQRAAETDRSIACAPDAWPSRERSLWYTQAMGPPPEPTDPLAIE